MAQRSSFLAGRSATALVSWQGIIFKYGLRMSDLTSKLLDLIRIKGAAYIGKNLNPPWNMIVGEHRNLARFHLVLSGSTWIELSETRARERLNAGEFAIIPYGTKHFLKDNLESHDGTLHSIPDAEVGPKFEHFDKTQDHTSILCGYFQIGDSAPPALVSQLPPMLIGRGNMGGREDRIRLLFQLVELELSNRTAAQTAVLNRLTETLCIHAIHHWIECEALPDGHLNTLSDPRLQKVLSEIHDNPAAAWTVEDLAKICGLSRTAFSVYFKAAIGMSPINYIMAWRIQIARRLLEDGELTLDRIAEKTGYADVNAFNRAFKRVTGSPPGMYRRTSRKQP
jgi:AraC-like DNA-binding protein